jgi:SAM-dependent methyltransferase
MDTNPRQRARELATAYIQRGDHRGWFEVLYSEAEIDPCILPWADLKPNPNLLEWLDKVALQGSGKEALVIGCGLGDDAEELARRGFRVTAFDISPSAISGCSRRFPSPLVTYTVADLFAAPVSWHSRFAFVLESYTLQVLPPDCRAEAIKASCSFVSPGGVLLVISRGRNISDGPGTMPWPLTRGEFRTFENCGLRELSFEDYVGDETPPVRRFRATYEAPAPRAIDTEPALAFANREHASIITRRR